MAQITAAMVKQLREMTDSPMMECKKALVEADGDIDKAVDILRTMGIAKAVKRAGRDTNEGTIATYVSEDQKLGAILEVEIKTKNLRRLAALTAKQVIVQGIREAERANIVKEYESKREEIVTATVVRVDEMHGNVVLATGTSNATLLLSEQLPGERFAVGDRVKVMETRPLSRDKRWRLVEVIEKAK